MPFLWRSSNFSCFYCGASTPRKQAGRVDKFKCDHCLAVNYLDQDGNITDPPLTVAGANSTPPPRRFASSAAAREDLVFCDACLKNQHILREQLAQFLPDENDSRYEEYCRKLPEFKRRKEQELPQICSDCAPRARERISQAAYMAKTDHIQRLMDASRSGAIPVRRQSFWRSLLFVTGGLVWRLSLLVQCLWHLLGLFAESRDEGLTSLEDPRDIQLGDCLRQVSVHYAVSSACIDNTAVYTAYALVGAVLSFWWNPLLYARYLGRTRGRLTHLADYYCHCMLVLAIRALGAGILSQHLLTGNAARIAHGGLMVCLIGTAVSALWTVKLDTTPRVSFSLDPSKILPNIPQRDPSLPKPLRTGGFDLPSADTQPEGPTYIRPEQFSHLANTTAFAASQFRTTPDHLRQRLPSQTPEPQTGNFDDPDAMDWSPAEPEARAPTTYNLRPRVVAPRPPLIDGANPFQVKIPQAPSGRMHHPRAPHPPPFMTTPQTQALPAGPRNFFAESRSRRERSVSTETEMSDQTEADSVAGAQGTRNGRSRDEVYFQPPKLVLAQDKQETGLENIFDAAFSFRDEPVELREDAQPSNWPQEQRLSPSGGVRMFEVHRDTTAQPKTQTWLRLLQHIFLCGVVPALILGIAWLVQKRAALAWNTS